MKQYFSRLWNAVRGRSEFDWYCPYDIDSTIVALIQKDLPKIFEYSLCDGSLEDIHMELHELCDIANRIRECLYDDNESFLRDRNRFAELLGKHLWKLWY